MFQWAWGAAAEIIKTETRDFSFFFPPLRASGYIFISGDMMRLLPSHHAAVQRKDLKIQIFVFLSAHMYAPAMTPSQEGLFWRVKIIFDSLVYPWKGTENNTPGNMSTARRPWAPLQCHLVHAFTLFNLARPLWVQSCLFIYFFNHFSLQTEAEMFQRSCDKKTGVFGNLQHHLRKTFHW